MTAARWNLSEPFSQAHQSGALSLEEASLLEDWEIAQEDQPDSLEPAVQRLYLWLLQVESRQQ